MSLSYQYINSRCNLHRPITNINVNIIVTQYDILVLLPATIMILIYNNTRTFYIIDIQMQRKKILYFP